MGSIGPELLARLFDAHAAALRLYARQWCEVSDAEDAVQEAFLNLARQSVCPTKWQHGSIAWSATPPSQQCEAGTAGSSSRRGHPAGRSGSPRRTTRLTPRMPLELLAELELDCREVIVARIWGGLTFDQIARLQGCSLTTAHRRYPTRSGPTS